MKYRLLSISTVLREWFRQLEQDILNKISPIDTQTSFEAANLRVLFVNTDTSLSMENLLIAVSSRQHSETLTTANTNGTEEQSVHELLDVDIVPTTE